MTRSTWRHNMAALAVLSLILGMVPATLAQSTEEASEIREQLDIPYTEGSEAHERQKLDVHGFDEPGDRPIMVFVHGGGWRFGRKDHVQGKPTAFHKRNWVFASIDYRMHPEVTYQEQGHDVARAIRLVHDHAREFGGSADKIFLMGHSAGAHLAALVAIDERYLKSAGLSRTDLAGVILLDGAGYDVARQIKTSVLPRAKELYETVFSRDPERQRDASPIEHVGDGQGIAPFLLVHVARRPDSRVQAQALAKR
ncbi:MAG TPA: alpha/beta hydrolase, partial [Pirellulaceae bacterium]